MNEHDHALVIGISRYADADDPSRWISNLRGPDNDAEAMAEWLRRADGGGLPHGNVRLIRSADERDPSKPQQSSLVTALDEITDLPLVTPKGYAGRRLYIYACGHGMARARREAALISAEAQRENQLNVLLPSWIDWCYEAARFEELVLWFDGCATRRPTAIFKACVKDPLFAAGAAEGHVFQVYAAGVDQKAVEREIDGTWHGVFTYALLQGLKGAAGQVVDTGSLRKYLQNTMRAYMDDDQRVPSVAKEPNFGHTDDITFATYPEPRRYPVTLVFPGTCAGQEATIGVKKSRPAIARKVLVGTTWKLDLAVGVYAALVPGLDLAMPFEVIGRGTHADITLR